MPPVVPDTEKGLGRCLLNGSVKENLSSFTAILCQIPAEDGYAEFSSTSSEMAFMALELWAPDFKAKFSFACTFLLSFHGRGDSSSTFASFIYAKMYVISSSFLLLTFELFS